MSSTLAKLSTFIETEKSRKYTLNVYLTDVFFACVGVFVVNSLIDDSYNEAIFADARRQVIEDKTPRVINVTKDGVAWTGNMVEGFAFDSKAEKKVEGALTKCWTTTFQIRKGYENIFLPKRFGGKKDLPFALYENPNFNGSTTYNCQYSFAAK